jgi:hypothetical protein
LREEKSLNKHGETDKKEQYWKIVYFVFCLALLIFSAWQILAALAFNNSGWDYQTYASAVQAFGHGLDPYIPQNLISYLPEQFSNNNLAFDYPPHTLFFFWLLNFFSLFHTGILYVVSLFALLVVSAYVISTLDENPQYLLILTLIFTGFMSAFWNFITGNSPILFLFLFAVIFLLWKNVKYRLSSLVMGFSAAISLFTAPFIALFLVIESPLKERLKLIAISFGVVASLFFVDYLTNPHLLFSYINLMQSSAGPFFETGGWNNPTPYLLFKDLLKGIFPKNIMPVVMVSCIYIGMILYATWRYYLKNALNPIKSISLIMISIFMILPRLMPYDFIILVVPLYILLKDYTYQRKLIALFVLSLPYYIWLYTLLTGINLGLLYYIQTYSLILIFLIIILQEYFPLVEHQKLNSNI